MSRLSFVDFFTDVYGYPPLPWQARLASKLIEDHTWPDLIDLPTGSGKTACLDIALFHLAWCAERDEAWRAARRIVCVVDRRLIVDSTATRADALRKQLENPRTEAIERVAHALKKLAGKHLLLCEKLRGGMPRERGVVLDPVQPMIITSTVDQVGSRLLFRGYGLSSYAHSIHAGLLGHDTLVLVDEAHLSTSFIETVTAIRARQRQADHPLKSLQLVRLVPLSATASTSGTKFQLDSRDLANPKLEARRTAPKPTRLVAASETFAERMKALLRETLETYASLDTNTPKLAVIVNRVRTARALYQRLAEEGADRFDVELMIGRCRPLDRDAVATRVISRVGAGITAAPERGLIVVATQTIEVGADLDFHGLVTECAAMDALRQRFGRLDRLGGFRKAQAVIVGSGETDDDPVYGAALRATWLWLQSVPSGAGGAPHINFSIDSMERLTRDVDLSPMNCPLRERLTLTSAHIDLLAQTSPKPMYEPDLQALLHGVKSGAADVQVIWRADLPMTREQLLDASEHGVSTALLELNPPTSLESLAVPLADVRVWLCGGKDETALADVEGVSQEEAAADAQPRSRFVLRRSTGERWAYASAAAIRSGDTIVVPSAYGGCDQFGFAPGDVRAVTDLSAAAREALKKSAFVAITECWLESHIADSAVLASLWRHLQEMHRKQVGADELLAQLLERISHWVPSNLAWLHEQPLVDVILSAKRGLYALVVTERTVRPGDISGEDLSSSYTVPIPLAQHNDGVARQALTFAQALSLEPEHVEHVACAGRLHDIGKADPRFQQMLRSGDVKTLPGQLLAKGLRRSSFTGAEAGERHEAYSVALLKRYPELLAAMADPELVLYLIGSHHGRGRALMPDVQDEGAAFALELAGRSYSFEGSPKLGALGSEWSSLFWRVNRRYGPWGIAYLEAIVRLADWTRSEEEAQGSES